MTVQTQYKLILTGGQTLMRAGLSSLLASAGHHVLSQPEILEDLHQTLAQTSEKSLVIFDDVAEGALTLENLKKVLILYPDHRYLLLVDAEKIETIRMAFQAGLHGVVPKNSSPVAFLGILDLIMRGESVFPSRVIHTRRPVLENEQTRLTPREEQIVLCLARGVSNKEIARELEVAEGTVKVHVKAILKKLSLTNRTQVAIYAHDRGYV